MIRLGQRPLSKSWKMGCGASRFSFIKSRVSASPPLVPVPASIPTAQTNPPQTIDTTTEDENGRPDTYGGDSHPPEKPTRVTTVAEIEVADPADGSHSVDPQPEKLTPAPQETPEPHSGGDEGASSAPDDSKMKTQTAALLEAWKSGTALLTSHAVVFEDLQTKSLTHVELTGKSDNDTKPLKSMSATAIPTSHDKEKRNNTESQVKADGSSHTSVPSLNDQQGETTTGVHSETTEAQEETTQETQAVEKVVTDQDNDGKTEAEGLNVKESSQHETVETKDGVVENAKEEKASETPDEREEQAVDSTNETLDPPAKEEDMSAEGMCTAPATRVGEENDTTEPVHSADITTHTDDQSTTETNTGQVNETSPQTLSTIAEDKASEKSADNEKTETELKLGQSKSCTTSQAELDQAPSTATGSKSSLSKTEGSQMVEKVEIDHSTGQSQASLVEAVERAVPAPVVTNT